MMPALFEAISSFWTSRRFAKGHLSRAEFEAWQAKKLAVWLRQDLPKVRAYHGLAPRSLEDLPLSDKASLMADFAAYNREAIEAEELRHALEGDMMVRGLTVGASTGTSGNRGYFVISERERYRWLGALIGKAIPDLLLRKQRVAVILPQNTRLYDSARSTGRLELRFFDITLGPETWREALLAYAPTILIAPPRLLLWCAEEGLSLPLKRVFSAAETLDPADRDVIERWSGQRLAQIYMATEGLLGVSCAHHQLHLAEDSVVFEYEDVGEGLVSPRITSFRRQEQIMARYRMNDLLRLAPAPCSCGSPLQAVAEVVGRRDDCFEFNTKTAEPRLITPDALRNAVVKSDPTLHDYRVIRAAEDLIELQLPLETSPEAAARAEAALNALLQAREVSAKVQLIRSALALDPARKLRRIENRMPR